MGWTLGNENQLMPNEQLNKTPNIKKKPIAHHTYSHYPREYKKPTNFLFVF